MTNGPTWTLDDQRRLIKNRANYGKNVPSSNPLPPGRVARGEGRVPPVKAVREESPDRVIQAVASELRPLE